jgi:Bacterial mobilisation protein (MobC)
MSKKSFFRIDLGELDPHFERYAARHGLDVGHALSHLLTLFLKGDIHVPKLSSSGRKVRVIGLASDSEKTHAQALAAACNLSLGRAIRLLALEEMFAASDDRRGQIQSKVSAPGGYVAVVGAVDNSHARLELRPTSSELGALTTRAKAGGFGTVQDMVLAVLRAFLTRSPVIEPDTVAALGRTNLSLVRIGTNLNQMARALNGGGVLGAAELKQFSESIAAIEAHTHDIAAALSNARGRWCLEAQGEQAQEQEQEQVKAQAIAQA